MNTTGHIFRLTTFGESHGEAIGGVVDGMPSGIAIDTEFIQAELDRRRPGQSTLTTARREPDKLQILSGTFEGKSTGCPIAFIVANTNQHSGDYDNLRHLFRPSHADYTYTAKYGIRDHRGGGRSSARETISRVVAGALAKLALRSLGITVTAWTQQVGPIALVTPYQQLDLSIAETNPVRCPDPEVAEQMAQLISQVKAEGDTIGGIVQCVVRGCPPGLGSPAFGKLHAQLAAAMLSINAAKGFDYGSGFDGITQRGSEQNDIFLPLDTNDLSDQANNCDALGQIYNGDAPAAPATHCAPRLTTATNRSGGIQGGISNGQDIYFRVAFKPVATLLMPQPTVDDAGRSATVTARGRHDPCVLPRAVPVVEAMTAITILDAYLQQRATHLL